jgi:hypothetical protein
VEHDADRAREIGRQGAHKGAECVHPTG